MFITTCIEKHCTQTLSTLSKDTTSKLASLFSHHHSTLSLNGER